jgi:hypothetical protein
VPPLALKLEIRSSKQKTAPSLHGSGNRSGKHWRRKKNSETSAQASSKMESGLDQHNTAARGVHMKLTNKLPDLTPPVRKKDQTATLKEIK